MSKSTQPVVVLKAKDVAPAAFSAATSAKDDDLTYDLGNLTAFDEHPVDWVKFNQNKEQYLLDMARDNTQLLINKVFRLPVEKSDLGPLATLPAPTMRIPRARPLPKPKAPTRWEKFAKEKGITKKKKGRMVWDDAKEEWAPAWGYKRANDDSQDWAMEVKNNGKTDPFEDPWTAKKNAKKARVEKNKAQQAENLDNANGTKKKLPLGIPLDLERREAKRGKEGTGKALTAAQVATASLGKFDQMRPGEPERKQKGKRHKFDPLVSSKKNEEKERYAKIASKVLSSADRKERGMAVEQEDRPTPENQKRKKGKGSGKREIRRKINEGKRKR